VEQHPWKAASTSFERREDVYSWEYIATIPGYISEGRMPHPVTEKRKLLNRTRRIRGQIEAIERALIADEGCEDLMRLITASRGAINSLMAEVINGHIRAHMVDPSRTPSARERAAASVLVQVLRSYVG